MNVCFVLMALKAKSHISLIFVINSAFGFLYLIVVVMTFEWCVWVVMDEDWFSRALSALGAMSVSLEFGA